MRITVHCVHTGFRCQNDHRTGGCPHTTKVWQRGPYRPVKPYSRLWVSAAMSKVVGPWTYVRLFSGRVESFLVQGRCSVHDFARHPTTPRTVYYPRDGGTFCFRIREVEETPPWVPQKKPNMAFTQPAPRLTLINTTETMPRKEMNSRAGLGATVPSVSV